MSERGYLSELQGEVGLWSRRNFGDQPSTLALLGLQEEVGELAHAHLKGLQGIRHTTDEIRAMKVDAVGDVVVYLADYCEREGIDLQAAVEAVWDQVSRRRWVERPLDAAEAGQEGGAA